VRSLCSPPVALLVLLQGTQCTVIVCACAGVCPRARAPLRVRLCARSFAFVPRLRLRLREKFAAAPLVPSGQTTWTCCRSERGARARFQTDRSRMPSKCPATRSRRSSCTGESVCVSACVCGCVHTRLLRACTPVVLSRSLFALSIDLNSRCARACEDEASTPTIRLVAYILAIHWCALLPTRASPLSLPAQKKKYKPKIFSPLSSSNI
jgi:hypothetical protein